MLPCPGCNSDIDLRPRDFLFRKYKITCAQCQTRLYPDPRTTGQLAAVTGLGWVAIWAGASTTLGREFSHLDPWMWATVFLFQHLSIAILAPKFVKRLVPESDLHFTTYCPSCSRGLRPAVVRRFWRIVCPECHARLRGSVGDYSVVALASFGFAFALSRFVADYWPIPQPVQPLLFVALFIAWYVFFSGASIRHLRVQGRA